MVLLLVFVDERKRAVSGKGNAGLSILPFGVSGIRLRGTNTNKLKKC